jgi:hypothetical protein
MDTQEEWGIRISDIRFMRHDPQSIELLLRDSTMI